MKGAFLLLLCIVAHFYRVLLLYSVIRPSTAEAVYSYPTLYPCQCFEDSRYTMSVNQRFGI